MQFEGISQASAHILEAMGTANDISDPPEAVIKDVERAKAEARKAKQAYLRDEWRATWKAHWANPHAHSSKPAVKPLI